MWVKLAHEKRARGQIPAPDNPFPPSPACYVTDLAQKQRNSFFIFCPTPIQLIYCRPRLKTLQAVGMFL